jgi:hypothetical protein
MKRRPVSAFSLSFLDIMFCGFGAVVLLVLILNHDTVKARSETFSDLRSEVVRLEQEVLVGEEQQVTARNSLEAIDSALVLAQGDAEQVIQHIRDLEIEIARMEKETQANRVHVNKLTSDLKSLDKVKKRLGSQAPRGEDQGDKVHRTLGEGDRQYLTGLKVGGKRILILIDASASMLDETIVNVIRRRNMDSAQKRSAPKWRRTLATAEWLVSNLPSSADFQLYVFNTRAQAVLSDSKGKWLSAASSRDVEGALTALRKKIPEDGTSLYQAFAVAKQLSPAPDNILLVTDGLPTQGSSKPKRTTVSSDERLDHFDKAARSLASGIPVNTILMPMEGDAWAAAAGWKLAIDTQGSFMTPARDWP